MVAKTWALAIANGGIALASTVSVILTNSAWPLVSLLLVPVNLFVWQYTRQGVMVVSYEEGDELQVTLDTAGEKERG